MTTTTSTSNEEFLIGDWDQMAVSPAELRKSLIDGIDNIKTSKVEELLERLSFDGITTQELPSLWMFIGKMKARYSSNEAIRAKINVISIKLTANAARPTQEASTERARIIDRIQLCQREWQTEQGATAQTYTTEKDDMRARLGNEMRTKLEHEKQQSETELQTFREQLETLRIEPQDILNKTMSLVEKLSAQIEMKLKLKSEKEVELQELPLKVEPIITAELQEESDRVKAATKSLLIKKDEDQTLFQAELAKLTEESDARLAELRQKDTEKIRQFTAIINLQSQICIPKPYRYISIKNLSESLETGKLPETDITIKCKDGEVLAYSIFMPSRFPKNLSLEKYSKEIVQFIIDFYQGSPGDTDSGYLTLTLGQAIDVSELIFSLPLDSLLKTVLETSLKNRINTVELAYRFIESFSEEIQDHCLDIIASQRPFEKLSIQLINLNKVSIYKLCKRDNLYISNETILINFLIKWCELNNNSELLSELITLVHAEYLTHDQYLDAFNTIKSINPEASEIFSRERAYTGHPRIDRSWKNTTYNGIQISEKGKKYTLNITPTLTNKSINHSNILKVDQTNTTIKIEVLKGSIKQILVNGFPFYFNKTGPILIDNDNLKTCKIELKFNKE